MNNTIVEGLKPYALGEKLRNLRLKKSMGLVELGRHTGLSPAMLSKLERGKIVSHAADPVADCHGVRSRPGFLLHR